MNDPWTFTVPGQPISTNHAYKRASIRLGDGSISKRMVKTREAEIFQDGVGLIARAAKPSGWTPLRWIRVYYELFLGRDIDCDNIGKLPNDAIAAAIGVNDKIFLPCYGPKVIGDKNPRMVITISTE
jgi:hypothetical protein